MRYYLWGLLFAPFIVILLIFIINRKENINIIASDDFTIAEFSDTDNGGESSTEFHIANDTLKALSTLKQGYEFPYTGLQIFKSNNSYFDLSDYEISLKIKVNYDVRLSIRRNQYIEGYTDSLDQMTYQLLVKSFGLLKGENEIKFNIEDINEIPDWWILENLKYINKPIKVGYDKTKFVWLYIENSTPINKPLQIEISEFVFSYPFIPLLYKWSLFALIYYLIFIIVIWRIKKVKYILMPIELSSIGNKIPETIASILEYIGSEYKNSDLRVYDAAKAVGISQDQVSELIRKHSNLTFRQYLNKVRLEEAKRLIRNTQLQISEIAYEVGYNNIQHFNRVFKEYTSFTPKEFRELK